MSTKPVIGPIIQLLTSRKFIIILSYIAAQLLIRAIPSLAPYVNDLTNVLTVAAGALFGHLSIEDIIKLKAQYTPTSLPDAANTALTGVVSAAFPLVTTPTGPTDNNTSAAPAPVISG